MTLALVDDRLAICAEDVSSVTINAVGRTKILMKSGYEYNLDSGISDIVNRINEALNVSRKEEK